MVKNPPAVWETWVWSLGWKASLKEGKATHSSMLAWRIPCTEEPGGLQFMGLQKSQTQLSESTTTLKFKYSESLWWLLNLHFP